MRGHNYVCVQPDYVASKAFVQMPRRNDLIIVNAGEMANMMHPCLIRLFQKNACNEGQNIMQKMRLPRGIWHTHAQTRNSFNWPSSCLYLFTNLVTFM